MREQERAPSWMARAPVLNGSTRKTPARPTEEERLAKVLRIYPQEPLSEGASVSVKLNGAKSYTECSLGDLFGSWSKTLTVEKRPAQLVANYENAVVLQSDALNLSKLWPTCAIRTAPLWRTSR